MRVYFISLLSYIYVPERHTGEMRSYCFHGRGYRAAGLDLHYAAPQYLGDAPLLSARLVRSGAFIPKLFDPGRLFVTADVADRLASFRNIHLLEATYEKLVNLSMDQCNASMDQWWSEMLRKHRTLEHPFELFDDDPALHPNAPRVYELVAPRYERVFPAVQSPQTHLVKYTMHPFHGEPETREIRLSEQYLSTYPVSQFGEYVISEDLYRVIAPYIDLNYFRVAECTLA